MTLEKSHKVSSWNQFKFMLISVSIFNFKPSSIRCYLKVVSLLVLLFCVATNCKLPFKVSQLTLVPIESSAIYAVLSAELSRILKCASWQLVLREHPDYSRDQNRVWGQNHNLSCRLIWDSRVSPVAAVCGCSLWPCNHNHPQGVYVLWLLLIKNKYPPHHSCIVNSITRFSGLFGYEKIFLWES